jgi:hypothetical protein
VMLLTEINIDFKAGYKHGIFAIYLKTCEE